MGLNIIFLTNTMRERWTGINKNRHIAKRQILCYSLQFSFVVVRDSGNSAVCLNMQALGVAQPGVFVVNIHLKNWLC